MYKKKIYIDICIFTYFAISQFRNISRIHPRLAAYNKTTLKRLASAAQSRGGRLRRRAAAAPKLQRRLSESLGCSSPQAKAGQSERRPTRARSVEEKAREGEALKARGGRDLHRASKMTTTAVKCSKRDAAVPKSESSSKPAKESRSRHTKGCSSSQKTSQEGTLIVQKATRKSPTTAKVVV